MYQQFTGNTYVGVRLTITRIQGQGYPIYELVISPSQKCLTLFRSKDPS